MLVRSVDSGENSMTYSLTWTENLSSGFYSWSSIASSSDGSYIIAAVNYGYVYLSRDGGSTWTQVSGLSNSYWTGVEVSSTGQKMIAVSNYGYTYVSFDYGQTWNSYGSYNYWKSVAISRRVPLQPCVSVIAGCV